MTEVDSPREKLEREISNETPFKCNFNGQPIEVTGLSMVRVQKAWDEIIEIVQAFYSSQISLVDADNREEAVAANFQRIKALGPDALKLIKKFIQAGTTGFSDEMFEDADQFALMSLVLNVLEFNIGPRLLAFFERGKDVLEPFGFKIESQDTSQNSSSSKTDGQEKISNGSQ